MVDQREYEYFNKQRAKRKTSSSVELNKEENSNLRLNKTDYFMRLDEEKKLTDNDGDSLYQESSVRQKHDNNAKIQQKKWNKFVDDMPTTAESLTAKINRRKKLMDRKEQEFKEDKKQLEENIKAAKEVGNDARVKQLTNTLNEMTEKHTKEMKALDSQIGTLTDKRANLRFMPSDVREDAYQAQQAFHQSHQNPALPYNGYKEIEHKDDKDNSDNKNNEDKETKNPTRKEQKELQNHYRSERNHQKRLRKEEKRETIRQKRTERANRTLQRVTKNSNVSNKISSKLASKSTGKGLKAKLANALKGLVQLMLAHPEVSIPLIVIIILLGVLMQQALELDTPYTDYFKQVSQDTIEYNAWTDAFNDEQIDFYNQYRTTVSGTNLAPIIYVMKDDIAYKQKVEEAFSHHKLGDFKTEKGGQCVQWKYRWGITSSSGATQQAIATKECAKYSKDREREPKEQIEEYYKAIYKEAVGEYIKDLNIYELRELFLKEVKYDYSYFKRDWTDWITQSPPKKIDTKTSSVEAEQNHLTNEAYRHNELEPLSTSVEVVKYRMEEYYVNEKVENGYDYCIGKGYKWNSRPYLNCRKGKHEENVRKEREVAYSEWETITYYKFRDIVEGSEEWVKDYSQAEKNTRRSSLNTPETLNKKAIEGRSIEGTITENGKTKEWESRYYDNSDVIVRRIRYWDLYTYKEVVDKLIDEYRPETDKAEYQGDQITLTANDDVYGTVYIPFNKTKIYKAYYSGNPLILTSNYFKTPNKEKLRSELMDMKQLLMTVFSFSGDFNPFPDFENIEAWKHSNEGGTNNFAYGQCTWFAYGLVYQNYGPEAASYLNGNGNQMAEVSINNSNGYWTEGDISNGAIISFGVGSSGPGHVGMIWLDDDKIMIAEGNIDGITNDWGSAILDYQITEQNPSDWSKWYGGSIKVAIPSGAK